MHVLILLCWCTFCLQAFSSKCRSGTCLCHLFTDQSFSDDGNVLGLGYVASPNPFSPGGICSQGSVLFGLVCCMLSWSLVLLARCWHTSLLLLLIQLSPLLAYAAFLFSNADHFNCAGLF